MKIIIYSLIFILLGAVFTIKGYSGSFPTKSKYLIKVEQKNYLGFTTYIYSISKYMITIDSVIDTTSVKRIYTKKLSSKQYLKINGHIPNILKLNTNYFEEALDGVEDRIIIYHDGKEIKNVFIDNAEVKERDLLFDDINELISTGSLRLVILWRSK